MAIVGIRDLNKNTKAVIERLVQSREPVILTRQGQPIATILPLDQRRINDLVISTAPEFVDTMNRAEEEFDAGGGTSFDDVAAEISARHAHEEEALTEVPQSAPEADVTATALIGVGGATVGALLGDYVAAVRELVAERARRLSETIVDEATEEGVLTRESGREEVDAEPLEVISEVNERLYGFALAAEQFRVVEDAVGRPSGGGAQDPIGEALTERASEQVRNVNRCVLAQRKGRGSISLTEYARSLQEASGSADAGESLIAELRQSETA